MLVLSVLGEDIAEFLRQLVDSTGTDRKYITLVGVSLGSHVVGRASSLYRIGRIIGESARSFVLPIRLIVLFSPFTTK